ncbi:hypothetical protein [Pseudonocardia acaciae]|uniref:hypothetical protein n=1 Tax=Pseudonocardia acaciae TaxID=551276 RepID=UPI0005674227|nr:hypothetical protein [Pseudonocardia acaciae]
MEVQRRTPASPSRPRRWHWLLLIVPFLWCIVAVPWAGSVGYAFGHVPFLLVWMVLGVIVGSAAIGVAYAIDSARGDIDRT